MNEVKKIKLRAILLLIVLAVAALTLVLPLFVSGSVSTAGPNASTKNTLRALDGALAAYVSDHNLYPPSSEDNGGEEEGARFKYRNDILVKYLDGDPTNGGGDIKYFDFEKEQLRGKNGLIYVDVFGEPFWYSNFQQRFLESPETNSRKILDENAIYHPWTNCINPRSYQIYSKVQYPKNPYGGQEKDKDNFKWITNYN